MRDIFNLGLLPAFVLVAGVIVCVTITVAWTIRQRNVGRLTIAPPQPDGSTHILPATGHTWAEDCACRPRVDGLHGQRFIEHRDLRAVRR